MSDTRLVAIPDVLPAHDVRRLDREHRPEDLVLLLADRPRFQGGRRLHGHERHHLQQVRDHHVLVRAGRLVEVGALPQPEGLRDVDLDVVDEVAVPDRLEQPVGEAERQDVLGRLLAEEVVDAEDLALVEGLVHLVVEPDGAVEVSAERLFHDHSRPLDELGVPQAGDHREGRLRGHAQVVQATDVRAELCLGGGDGGRQGARLGVHRQVRQTGGERLPLLVAEQVGAELADRRPGKRSELLVVERLERGTHDPDVWSELRRGRQVGEAREELATSQVAGRTEQHDHVRCGVLGTQARGTGTGGGVRDGLGEVIWHGGDPRTSRLPARNQRAQPAAGHQSS